MRRPPAHDWRVGLLRDVRLAEPLRSTRNPVGWPGYEQVSAVRPGRGVIAGHDVVVAVWDFAVYGGSLGELDAAAFASAVDEAIAAHRPLVTLLRTGGTRLQEGVAGLVGMSRATLAVRRLAAARVPHLSIVDAPTTGGVWVTIGSRADVRAGVVGATIGFAGPRVVEAITGAPPADSHSTTSAFDAGLLDARLWDVEVTGWLRRALDALAPAHGQLPPVPSVEPGPRLPQRTGPDQVAAARSGQRPDNRALLALLAPDGVDLRAPRADATACCRIGRLPGTVLSVVLVALASGRGMRASADAFRLLARAAGLADRLDLPLVTLVDTPGADPVSSAENDGLAAAVGAAMEAVLACRAPTVCVVTGEGGSGGALAAANCDELLVTPDCYFAALAPEGAAAALRIPADKAAEHARLRPGDLLALGFADAAVPAPSATAGFVRAVVAAVARQRARPARERLARREQRWGNPLHGVLA